MRPRREPSLAVDQPPAVAAAAPSTLLASLLAAYDAAWRDLPARVDASWLEAAGLGAGGGAWSARRLPLALGLKPVAAADLLPPAHRLALLPPPVTVRLLRLRALLPRRRLLRRCLDARLQRWLQASVGAAAAMALLTEAEDAAAAPGLPVSGGNCAQLDRALAWEGFCRFAADGVWREPSLRRLLQLGFPCSAAAPAALASDARDSGWIFARLGRFVPEVPWLSG